MKFKKIISAVSAFAMAASLFTVASAASLGGKPTVTATFAGYEIDTEYDNQIVAKINFKLDGSAAEALEVYSESGKGASKVKKGNGISTLGVAWTVDFEGENTSEYWDDFNVDPLTLNSTGTSVAFGPKTTATDYLVDSVLEWTVRYAVYDNDAAGSVVINSASYDGKNTTENSVWSYHTMKGTIDVVGCSIPSYNEWSKPADPEPTVVPATAVTSATTGDDEVLDTTSKAAQAYVAEAAIASGDKVTWVAANRTSEIDATIANIDATTKLGLIITGDASTLGAISLKVAAN